MSLFFRLIQLAGSALAWSWGTVGLPLCRAALRFTCQYLLPFARQCDRIAFYVAGRWQRLGPYTWYVAAILLWVVVALHAYLVHVLTTFWNPVTFLAGPTGPCVCAASESRTGRRYGWSTVSFVLMATYELLQAILVWSLAVLSLLSELVVLCISRPVMTSVAALILCSFFSAV